MSPTRGPCLRDRSSQNSDFFDWTAYYGLAGRAFVFRSPLVFEKYLALARDAQSSGDRIGAENFYQHAEHYYRILNVNAQNDRDRSQSNGSGQGGAVNGRSTSRGKVGSVDPAAAQPQPASQPPAQPSPEAAGNQARAPEVKPDRSRKPASQNGGSPDATSAETAET